MAEEKWLTIYFAPNYLRKALVVYDPMMENMMEFTEECFVELYSSDSMYSQPVKPFSKREQCHIADTIKGWVKEIDKLNEDLSEENKIRVELITHPLLENIEGSSSILDNLKSHLGLESEKFTSIESSRQSFLGVKSNLSNLRPNAKICYINVSNEHVDLVFGDMNKLDHCIQINFGAQQIAESIASLRRNNQQDSLALFVKANLYKYIEQVRFYGKPQIITFDENTAKLLSQTLSKDLRTNRVNAEWIQQLCYKVIDSESQYLNSKFEWIGSDSIDYVAAHIILIGFLLEGLGTSICSLDTESRIKGFILDKQIEKGKLEDLFLSHKYDWKKSAQEKLIHLNPQDYSRSAQLANLADKVFVSTHGWLHLWGEKYKRILWLSALFSGTLSSMEPELAQKIIYQLLGMNLMDCRLVSCTIAISCTTNLSGQSKYLDLLPPEHRSTVRKMASIIQIVKALDITGRSAVQDLKIEAKPKSPDKLIFRVFPRLSSEPELIQLNILKKNFENQFEQKVEVQVSGVPTEPEVDPSDVEANMVEKIVSG